MSYPANMSYGTHDSTETHADAIGALEPLLANQLHLSRNEPPKQDRTQQMAVLTALFMNKQVPNQGLANDNKATAPAIMSLKLKPFFKDSDASAGKMLANEGRLLYLA